MARTNGKAQKELNAQTARGMRRKQGSEKSKKKGTWPVTYKLAALGTLVAYTAIGNHTVAKAQAAPYGRPQSTRTTDRAALPTHRFDIPAGTLDDVLAAFEKVSSLQINVPDARIRSLSSPGVSGVFMDEQALNRILADTGITYSFTAQDTVTLNLTPLAESVTVSAAAESVELSKYTQPTLDTPQTINTVTQEVMQQQGDTTLRDALRNVAGISLAAGEGGSQGDNLTIRGFTARNDVFLDGFRDFGSYYRDPFDMESVAVLQGPSGVAFGRGSTGGVVSQTSKSPRLGGFTAGSLDLGSDATRRMTLDFDRPLAELGEHTAFRLNVMGNDTGVAGRHVATNRRYGVAPAIEFGLNTPTRLTVSYFREWEDDIPDYGIPWFFDRPAAVPRQNFYGFTHGNYLKTGDNVGTVKFEHDFSQSISISSQARYADYPRNAVITEPQINAPNLPTTPLSQIVVTRNEISVGSVESYLDDQTDVAAFFNTGSLRHTLVGGFEFGRETSDPTRFAYQNTPTANLLAPNPNQAPPTTHTVSSRVHTTAGTEAVYALDTVDLGAHWQVTGGIRWDRFNANYLQSVAPVASFNQVTSAPTWRGALVFKPKANGSVYFDYGTSFNPSAESLSLSVATASTPPEKNKTYEFGSKWYVGPRKLALDGALFRTEKTNAREPSPTDPTQNVLGGNQRVDGIEGTMSGYLTSRWELLSSYAYLHSEVVSSKYYPLSVGYQLANVPANTCNVWSSYKTAWRGMEFGAGTNFVDSRTASSTVPLNATTGLLKRVPGYWVVNAMVRYPISERIDFQVNAYNLANNYYYDEPHPAHIIPGAARYVTATLNFKFVEGKK